MRNPTKIGRALRCDFTTAPAPLPEMVADAASLRETALIARQNVERLERSLRQARGVDAEAAAAAIRAGKKAPTATSPKLADELVAASRELDAVALASRQAHADILAAVRGDIGTSWLASLDGAVADRSAQAAELVEQLQATLAELVTASAARRWVTLARRHPDRPAPGAVNEGDLLRLANAPFDVDRTLELLGIVIEAARTDDPDDTLADPIGADDLEPARRLVEAAKD